MDDSPSAGLTLTDLPEGLEISIPAPRNWVLLIFLAIWLSGWAFGEISAIRSLIRSNGDYASAGFLAFWLLGWTAGGSVALVLLLWMAVGREKIHVTADAFMIRREVLGIGRMRRCEMATIRRLRVEAQQPPTPRNARWINMGFIAFDCGDSTVRCGIASTPEQAQQIVDRIRGRFSIPE